MFRILTPLNRFFLLGSAVLLLIVGGCLSDSPKESALVPATPDKPAQKSAKATSKTTSSKKVAAAPQVGSPQVGAPQAETGDKTTQNQKKTKGTAIAWYTSFEEGMKEAKRTHRPILIDFYATWCGPCKLMDKNTWSDPYVVEESKNWIAIKVDAEKRQDVAAQYGVTGFPMIAFLRPDGKPANMFMGFQDARETLQSMRAAYSQAVGVAQTA